VGPFAAVGNALELTPAFTERKAVLDIDRAFGIVRQLFLRMFEAPQMLRSNPKLDVPLLARVNPTFEPLFVSAWFDEILDLHLLEFERPEDKVARRDFVSERFTYLCDAERQFAPHRRDDVSEVDEDALGGLRWQVGHVVLVFDWPDVGLEHGVEHARLAEPPTTFRALARLELIGAIAILALAEALHEWIVEQFDVARRHPNLWRRDQCRVEQLYVITKLDFGSEQGTASVFLDQHPQRTIVLFIGKTAINFSACEDKTAALAQCDQLLQIVELARWRLFRHSSGHTPKRVTNE